MVSTIGSARLENLVYGLTVYGQCGKLVKRQLGFLNLWPFVGVND